MLDWNVGDEVWVNAVSGLNTSQKQTWRAIVLPGTNGK